MTRLQSLTWSAWALIVHVAVLGIGLVLMNNLSSEGIIGLRYRKGGASEWQVTLKAQDLAISNRMLGAECVPDSSKAREPTATPCEDIWPATPQELNARLEQGFSYENVDPDKSFKDMCRLAASGCKVVPIRDACQALFERLGLGVDEPAAGSWGLKQPETSNKAWSDLFAWHKQAAQALGWTQEGWVPNRKGDDNDRSHRNSAPQGIRDVDWGDLNSTARWHLRALGYHEGNWNDNGGVGFTIERDKQVDVKEHFRIWPAVDRLWVYQSSHKSYFDDSLSGGGRELNGEEVCEDQPYALEECISKGCCQFDEGKCYSAVGKGRCGNFKGQVLAIQNRLLRTDLVSAEQSTIFGLDPISQDSTLDIFLAWNLQAPRDKRVYPLHWPVWGGESIKDESLELGPTAITEVNGKKGSGNAEEMKKTMLRFLTFKCPSGGEQYNPSAWDMENPLNELENLSEDFQDAYEKMWQSNQVDSDRLRQYRNRKTDDEIKRSFKNGNRSVLFFEASIQGDGEIVVDLSKRKLWKSLSSEQRQWATTLGYSSESWDDENAPLIAAQSGLVLTLSNYLAPNLGFAYVQNLSAIVLLVLVFFEMRHMLETVVVCNILQLSIRDKALAVSIAFFCYVAVPVVVLLTSFLVINESPTELDVVKDALALLFLLEVNNYMHIATHQDPAPRWRIPVPAEQYKYMDRAKSRFTLFAAVSIFLMAGIIGILRDDLRTSSEVLPHASVLFNLIRGKSAVAIFSSVIVAIAIVCKAVSWISRHRSLRETSKQLDLKASSPASYMPSLRAPEGPRTLGLSSEEHMQLHSQPPRDPYVRSIAPGISGPVVRW